MKDNELRFLKSILLMAGIGGGILIAQTILEILMGGASPKHLSSLTPHEAQNLMNLLNGKLTQAMSVIFIVTGMAVPLTAHMYSLKFLDFFIRNPVNVAVLLFIICATLSGIWANYYLNEATVSTFQLEIMLVLTVVSLLVILPYLVYVFRFLHPRTLLHLLEQEGKSCLRGACSAGGCEENRKRLAETLEHIANISVKSVDQFDRNTAIEGVQTLERLASRYWQIKSKAHPSWFQTDQNLFLGFSSMAIEEMNASRTWTEMKLYSQFFEILRASCPRMPELTSTLAKGLRTLGLEAASLENPALRELVIEYFNTFIRLTLNRRDVRSVFILFDQYRTFAESLQERFPHEFLEIAYYFQYYGEAARAQQLPFVVETGAYDLGSLVKKAWQDGSSCRKELLDRFLAYDRQGEPALSGVKKAQALLAGYFLYRGDEEAAGLIAQNFRTLDPAFLRALEEELLQVTRQKYWEVSERRMNMEFVPAAHREKLREFFALLLKRPGQDSAVSGSA